MYKFDLDYKANKRHNIIGCDANPIIIGSKNQDIGRMNRYMKYGKIDFFQSPHPSHFDLHLFREARECMEELDPHGGRLFTPLRPTPPPFTPLALHDLVGLRGAGRTAFPVISFEGTPEQMENEQQLANRAEINEKLEFSEEEDLLLPITPEKVIVVEEEGQTTARKPPHYHSTPQTEGKFYERGLKKLAYEAFRFVSNQKKTTYKEVATKLINQLNDDNELDIHRKGEMNIKRRVYDALNVLIALGLLKRNGNKILGKKPESESISLERDKQKRKEENLEEELENLRRDHLMRGESIRQKQRTIETMKDRLRTIKQLTQRNRALRDHAHTAQKCVQLPFLVVVQSEPVASENQQTENQGGDSLQFWREGVSTLHGRCTGNFKPTVWGDMDAIAQIKIPAPQRPINQKTQRLGRSRGR